MPLSFVSCLCDCLHAPLILPFETGALYVGQCGLDLINSPALPCTNMRGFLPSSSSS